MDRMDVQPRPPIAAPTGPKASASLLHRIARRLPPRSWFQFFPPRVIEWNRYDLPARNLPAGLHGLRLLHLTDMHFRRHWPAAYEPLLAAIRRDPPDLLLITGDFVDNKNNYHIGLPTARRLVEGVTARFGCFAIHGNHDHYEIGRTLRGGPVTFLDGRRRIVDTPGGSIELIGLPGLRRRQTSPALLASLPPREPGMPRIVLSHFPDNIKRAANLDADVFLAGHTHGGQICMPGGVAMMWHDSLPRPLCKGAHRVGDTWLVVSRGLGHTGLPLRMFCPPEVVEVRLMVRGGERVSSGPFRT